MEIPLRIYRKIGFFKSKNMQSADTSLAAAKKAQTCKPLQKKSTLKEKTKSFAIQILYNCFWRIRLRRRQKTNHTALNCGYNRNGYFSLSFSRAAYNFIFALYIGAAGEILFRLKKLQLDYTCLIRCAAT